ncbi:hypothetical protein [Alteromonas oceanisediminis]|uniref:hypothetical protein n=1 Tax=Alteromonas oceanisediminis TaxID=2836180 RepID=UPI001BDABD79|nr:hypothetical protein [Alteromonas oceanisediminis]MBT0586143.1 hypothetical protein [Alteromonas oceanisediminis]
MSSFTLLLVIKIMFTLLLVAVPFLLLPKKRLEQSTHSQHDNPLFFRLYGVAILALLVGYASAVPLSHAGVFSWGIATMGLVSNAGAALLLTLMGKGKLNGALAIFFSVIAVSLLMAMMFPEAAIKKLW